jgi:hypothetical protein
MMMANPAVVAHVAFEMHNMGRPIQNQVKSSCEPPPPITPDQAQGYQLTPKKVFTVISLFNVVSLTVTLFFPAAIQGILR